jgi:minor histocompatibility antigen H13
MVVFDHPQPALLFLVPGCTGSAVLKALIDNKFKEFWNYEQEPPKKQLPPPTEEAAKEK